MVIQIIPDYNLTNSNLEALLTNIHQYKSMFQRLKNKTLQQESIIFEILLSKEEKNFYLIIPNGMEELVLNELNNAYPKSTFREQKTEHMINPSGVNEFELKQHSFLSLKTNMKAEYPLSMYLETSRNLQKGEKVLIQYILTPCEQSTSTAFTEYVSDFETHKKLKPKTLLDPREAFITLGKVVYEVSAEILDTLSLLALDTEYERLNLDELRNNILFRTGLSPETKEKANSLYYDTAIRIGVTCARADMLLNLYKRSFVHLKGDNELVPRKFDFWEKEDMLIEAFKNRKQIDKWGEDALSCKELAQLMQLPTKYYQQEYNIQAIDTREINIPKDFLTTGIDIATVNYKGKKSHLKLPIDDPDSLCQVWMSIGKMGSGKTTAASNSAIQLLMHGVSVFAIDVADCKLINNIQNGLPRSFNKIIDLDFGDLDNPIPLSWSEMANATGRSTENVLSSQLKDFINKLANTDQEMLSDRMSRYLGACAKAAYKNPEACLYDVILCLTNRKYREKLIEDYGIDGRLKMTLLQLNDDKDKITGTKAQYITGIMDRLESLLDNEAVANCLLQKANKDIDFRKWANQGYFVGIRVPKDRLLDEATDLLVTYIVSKLWLAILTRESIDEKDRKPCMLILDEPHQFPTVYTQLFSIIREMRKWRLGIFILAHEFSDLKSLKNLFKAAGTNYFIYQTSKETYKELLEELSPFTLEELMKTKWRHAIVKMRYKDKTICVDGEMMRPLPGRQNYIRSNIFGVPRDKVEEELFARELEL